MWESGLALMVDLHFAEFCSSARLEAPVYKPRLVGGKVMMRRFNRLASYAPKTKRVPTAERITLLGSSARTKS